MAKIRMLSEDLIGKIAAGEVVERPAAAIKELVENSLDAGAKTVTVEIQEGGISSFRVTDDGCGIDESDLKMAFERHATSKIRTEEDLNAIGTLGFRGEALASIAAVGRVTLTTRTRERETGLRVKNEGGRIQSITETACAPGTSILVKDLFFNVPVRRGFLKKPNTETAAVTDLMTRLILSRPDVSFRYLSGGKMIYHSPGDGKTESAVLSIYGVHAVKSMRAVDGNEGGILIQGFVGIGENARNNRSGESFFINGRMMRSPLLSGSLEDACRERVMIGKYPICALYLTMPYENVNVNVHPNKLEVRFRDDRAVREAVYDLVYDALTDRDAFQRPVEMPLSPPAAPDALPERPGKDSGDVIQPAVTVEKGSGVPGITMAEKPMPVYQPVAEKPRPAAEPEKPTILPPPRTAAWEKIHSTDPVPRSGDKSDVPGFASFPDPEGRETIPGTERISGPAAGDGPILDPVEKESGRSETAAAREEQLTALTEEVLPKPMKIFGAVFNTFILVEYEDHLLLVDQHAVHERLLFDRMMKACESQQAGQEMLVPYVMGATKQEMQTLEENRELLESLGLSVEPFGVSEVAIRSVPIMLGENETAEFLREAIDELENGKIPGADKKRAAILQQACKHAVKGGEPLPESLLRSLVEEMIDKKVTPTCPHGRPLVVSISHTELDKKFKRIQS
ncbi:MAG: DNA mismatch repair endonuclease MutL [Clostridia bacterium]|nr:DNA mismatch repair endonuclease MutL [Clostridia bacterium]